MNGAVEGCGFPLIRQKHANEWGTVHLRFIYDVTRYASHDAKDDSFIKRRTFGRTFDSGQ